MAQTRKELNAQAGYDLGSARAMFRTGRYIYAVFMCHLAIEKALKGLYVAVRASAPPKTHNLISLLNAAGVTPPPDTMRLIARLNETSVTTRYPEKLRTLQRRFTVDIVRPILTETRKTLAWIRRQP